MAIQRIAGTTPRRKIRIIRFPLPQIEARKMLLRAVAKTHRDGLKIRRKQFHGGSIPLPAPSKIPISSVESEACRAR